VPSRSDVAPDGSPVEVYRRLPPLGEPELVSAVLPAGCEILELGCGAGRLTHRLLELGHRVTAVDESAAMLAHVRGAVTIQADIRALDLGRRFTAVLLASHFVNAPNGGERSAVLDACARHVTDDGAVVVQCYPPDFDWEGSVGREQTREPVTIRVETARRVGTRLAATVEYRVDERRWRQSFEAEILDEEALRASLRRAGLAFTRWLDGEHAWLEARLAQG
jgi:SAM-dependent methyltransferase